ncbi:MAG TPA: alpha/beta fold hydrolase [Ktedonobacteraceae bacterium]|nr:alpha/beta fold hydrolase [Ktedonobacteraceae bacterium]
MKAIRLCLLVFLLLLLAACSSGSPAQEATPIPTIPPVPTPPNIPSHLVSFSTEDHIKLAGLLYGQGTTMVICSHMSESSLADWRDSGIPERLAALGYQVLVYDFRGYGGSDGDVDPASLGTDLDAAVRFAHQQGATKIVLMGASMGGTASLTVAVKTPVAAVVSLSGPQSFGVGVSDTELKAMTVPKLFLASEEDEPFVTAAHHMYEIAASPKAIFIYPGLAHGTLMIGGDNGDGPALRILKFITQYAPAT